jgi:RNA-directed DNA polymerase
MDTNILVNHLVRSIKRFKSKITEILQTSHGDNIDKLIKRLNPLIKGTANYMETNCCKENIFSKMND